MAAHVSSERRPVGPAAKRVVAGALLLAIGALLYRGPRPLTKAAVQTESLHLWSNGAPQARLPLRRALLVDSDPPRLLTDVEIRLDDPVDLRLERISPDTLEIILAAKGASAGCITRGLGCIQTLERNPAIKLVLRPEAEGGRFLFPFRADSVYAGDQAAYPSGSSSGLLLSGQVSLLDRTVSGDTFTAASRTLETGEELRVWSPRGEDLERGYGRIVVSGTGSMAATFVLPSARTAVLKGIGRPEILATPRFARFRQDWLASLLGLVALYLVVHPAAELLGARLSRRLLQRWLPPHEETSG
jgi:hypothetical protein